MSTATNATTTNKRSLPYLNFSKPKGINSEAPLGWTGIVGIGRSYARIRIQTRGIVVIDIVGMVKCWFWGGENSKIV